MFVFGDRDRDYRMYYIIIDMIFIFIMCFWVGLWDQGFIGSLFVFIRIYDSMLFPFRFVVLGIPLLYKDNDPYVVMGIYFHFRFVVLGFCDNIWDSMFFYFSYIDDYVIWISFIIVILYHRAGIYFILGC